LLLPRPARVDLPDDPLRFADRVLSYFCWQRCALLDRDRALEVCSVFDDDLRRRQISVHRAVLLDLDLAFPMDIALHSSVHDHLASNDVGCQLCCSSDRLPPLRLRNFPALAQTSAQMHTLPRRRYKGILRHLIQRRNLRSLARADREHWERQLVHNRPIRPHLGHRNEQEAGATYARTNQ
jgi:hypothetical protein